MARRVKFSILYAPEVRRHIEAIPRGSRSDIRRSIEEQLGSEPARITKNRKPLEELPGPLGATWELRCGVHNQFRVFYELELSERQVRILAIGVKDRDRLFIGGEEFEL